MHTSSAWLSTVAHVLTREALTSASPRCSRGTGGIRNTLHGQRDAAALRYRDRVTPLETIWGWCTFQTEAPCMICADSPRDDQPGDLYLIRKNPVNYWRTTEQPLRKIILGAARRVIGSSIEGDGVDQGRLGLNLQGCLFSFGVTDTKNSGSQARQFGRFATHRCSQVGLLHHSRR